MHMHVSESQGFLYASSCFPGTNCTDQRIANMPDFLILFILKIGIISNGNVRGGRVNLKRAKGMEMLFFFPQRSVIALLFILLCVCYCNYKCICSIMTMV